MTAFHELAKILLEHSLNGMIAGGAIAAFAWILMRLHPRRSSSTRFAVWFAVLIAIVTVPLLVGLAAGGTQENASPSAMTLPASWAADVLVVWAVIAAAALLRVGIGLWQLRRLRARSRVLEISLLPPQLQRTWEEFESPRAIRIAISDELQTPAAIGFVHPRIILPVWTLQELSPDELNSVLLHELVHLRRWDDWTNLAQKVLRALFFFHPAVWWVESQLAVEREMACDDAVVAKTADRRSYAECLVAVAEKSFARRGLMLVQAAVSRVRQTSLRVAKILHGDGVAATRVWKPALGLVAAFATLCVALATQAPEFIAFRDPAPTLAASTAIRGDEPAAVIPARWSVPAKTPVVAREPARSRPLSKHNVVGHPPAQSNPSPVPLEAMIAMPNPEIPLPVKQDIPPQNAVTVQTMLVVMQSGSYSGYGQPFWTICVWRVSVIRPAPAASSDEIPAKSI